MKTINYIPKSKNFLIEVKGKTEGGLYIPDSAKNAINEEYVEVVLISPDCEFVNVGDKVLVENNPRTQLNVITIDGTEYIQLAEFLVLGKLKPINLT